MLNFSWRDYGNRVGAWRCLDLFDSLKLPYALLSDDTMAVAKSYKVVYGHTPGKTDYPHLKDKIAKRYFFLIDRDGIVRGKWLGENLAVFPTEVVLKAARDLTARR